MKIRDIVSKLELEVIVEADLDRNISGGYVGDLLSNVMARAEEDNLWITIQGHQNVVAVALLAGVSAVVIVEGFEVEEAAVERAEEKGVNILRTPKAAYELIKKLSDIGV